MDTEDDLDATYTLTVALALNPTVSVSVAVTVEDCGSGEGILDASLSPVVCVECPEGTSAPEASSRCEPCMPGTYANTKGERTERGGGRGGVGGRRGGGACSTFVCGRRGVKVLWVGCAVGMMPWPIRDGLSCWYLANATQFLFCVRVCVFVVCLSRVIHTRSPLARPALFRPPRLHCVPTGNGNVGVGLAHRLPRVH